MTNLAADYATVIRQCALEADLTLFQAGDQTEVGEKGVTLRYVKTYRHNLNDIHTNILVVEDRRYA